MMRQTEFDLLTKARTAATADFCSPSDPTIEAHVEKSRSEELEKRLSSQLSQHWSVAADYQSKITGLQRQLEQQTSTSYQSEIDLAREQDKNNELKDALQRLRTQSEDQAKQIRVLDASNDALHSQLEVKDATLTSLQEEIDTLRREYAMREEEFIALATTRDASLADLRISCDKLKSERERLRLDLVQAEEDERVSKESESIAKDRLVKVEQDCANKMKMMSDRERKAIRAATSDLEIRLQIAEEKATTAEKNEASANKARREAEMEAANIRAETEENLCKAKELIRCDYEQLLANKVTERVAIENCREADKLLMDDLRNKVSEQENRHKNEVKGHMQKLDELSCALQETNSDLSKEKDSTMSLKVDLANARTRLESTERQRDKDKQAWKQDISLLVNETAHMKEKLDVERSARKDEAAEHTAALNKGRAREQELQNQLQKVKERYKSEVARMETKAASAIQAIFAESQSALID